MSLLGKLLAGLRRQPAPGDPAPVRAAPHAHELAGAQALLNAGRFEQARQAYARLLAASPDFVPALNGHAVACNGLDDLPAAESSLRRALASAPQDAQTLGNLAVTLLRLQRLPEAAQAARGALTGNPACAEACFVLGEVLQREGDLETADDYFALSLRHDPQSYGVCGNVRLSPEFFRHLPESAGNDEPAQLFDPPPGDYDQVVLVSCDALYFERYGGSFINAYAQHAAARSLLHVHFIGSDQALPQRLSALAGKLGLPAVQCSMAPLPQPLAAPARPIYYASARMLHMAAWLKRYGRPIACFDIDALLLGPVDRLVRATQHADLGLVLHPEPYSPWTHVLAGTMLANPTPGAERYFSRVSDYLRYFFREAQPSWMLDQVALYCVLRHLEQAGRAPEVARIAAPVEEVVWQLSRITGGKENDALYARYRMDA